MNFCARKKTLISNTAYFENSVKFLKLKFNWTECRFNWREPIGATVSVSSATDNMFIYASVEIGLRKLFPQFASYSILLSVMKGVNKCKIFKLAFLERVLGPLWNRGSCLDT